MAYMKITIIHIDREMNAYEYKCMTASYFLGAALMLKREFTPIRTII